LLQVQKLIEKIFAIPDGIGGNRRPMRVSLALAEQPVLQQLIWISDNLLNVPCWEPLQRSREQLREEGNKESLALA
jgi:hypothetical protein